MSKLQRNSPMPLHVPKKRGKGDEGTEATKKGSTVVGQPELTQGNKFIKHGSSQFNERENGAHAYTD
jgi:hypothetical protein